MKVQNATVLQAWNFPAGMLFSQIMGRDVVNYGQGCAVGLSKLFLKISDKNKYRNVIICKLEAFPRKVFSQMWIRLRGTSIETLSKKFRNEKL